MKRTTVEELLKSRENRRFIQEKLISKYNKALISFTLNTPGEIKSSELLSQAHAEGMNLIVKELTTSKLPIIYHGKLKLVTGDEAYIIIDCDAKKLKTITVRLENTHPLGRLFDIDVFDAFGNQIKREMIGVDKRTCVICYGNTQRCRHLNNHSSEEVVKKYNLIMNEYFCK